MLVEVPTNALNTVHEMDVSNVFYYCCISVPQNEVMASEDFISNVNLCSTTLLTTSRF
jgi:hypothetical protein